MKIAVSSPIMETPRVLQVRGMFDLPHTKTSCVEWEVNLPLQDRPWKVGLIVGPSGCGKSTIANSVWPGRLNAPTWPPDRSILDGFPANLSIKNVAEILSSVGFASPPAWLRPFHVLSTGQQFRVLMARLIAEASPARHTPIVVDEFTSAVDRTAAKIGSAAVARAIRKKNLQLVAVTCHEDVEDWLGPDWVYRPAEQAFAWRLLQRRPAIDLQVVRCRPSAWPLFAPHHYLSRALARNAYCFLALWQSAPVAFSAWVPFFGAGPPTRREHRTVTLPDFQGVGIGNALSALIAGMWKALGYRAVSATAHPAMIQARRASPLWRMHRPPSFAGKGDRLRPTQHALTRFTAGFAYIGPAMKLVEAKALLGR
ncbi:MAG TPA: ABC transporter ATP-binding protein [Gemmataceae bacterium]|jgi:ABC-type lipoprotein export system ATPase subunit|nr:ABC transporter ATP-binding protein [Gemmataceae bacterium]